MSLLGSVCVRVCVCVCVCVCARACVRACILYRPADEFERRSTGV